MLAKFLGKIADLKKRWALVYILALVLCYIVGMVLVLLGVIIVEPDQFCNIAYFIPGLIIWVPTCVMTILTSISSNYSKEVAAERKKAEEKKKEKEAE